MLKDTTYHGYETLELITKHNLIDLLKSTVIDNVISSFWSGSLEADFYPVNQS